MLAAAAPLPAVCSVVCPSSAELHNLAEFIIAKAVTEVEHLEQPSECLFLLSAGPFLEDINELSASALHCIY